MQKNVGFFSSVFGHRTVTYVDRTYKKIMNVKILISLLNRVIHKQHIFVIQNLLKIVQNLLYGSRQKQTSLLICQYSHGNPDEYAVMLVTVVVHC